jgi:biopolymer transport protein TolR
MTTSNLRGTRGRKFKSDINVVPYIDVMLVLLIIFMVVAPLTTPSTIDLPKAGRSTQPPSDYIEIELKADGSASIGIHGEYGDQASSPSYVQASQRDDLMKRLVAIHSKHPDLPLMISADKSIKYDEVVQTIAQANKAGIARVGLSAR